MELSQHLLTAPRLLLALGLGSGAIALGLAIRLLRGIVRRLRGRATRPASVLRGGLALVSTLAFAGVAAIALGLVFALAGYHAFTARTHVAELQCVELGPGKLRLFYVPLDSDGHRGATESYDLDGDEWSVGGEILRFQPTLTLLGVSTVYAVHRVEGRWHSAADTNAHRPTAYDRDGGVGEGWLMLERNGTRGPLGWAISGVHGQSVSQLPDRLAIYDLYVTPNGYVLDKRSL